ncbi:MAG: UDP-N-acetylglucosamine--N-acetylmuramyl-(pentapeptide) pyrophosphoryl-undecaprenol N-acetylglucosamine transferase [Acidimicrobiales bacterium]
MSGYVITGGGTAGHTNPGIATAQALVELGVPATDVHFIGAERGSEGELVPAAGFTIDLLPGRGIRRSFSPDAIRDNAGAVWGLLRGIGTAVGIVRRRRPAAVLCLGGYAAFAGSLAAVLLRVPIVVSEQNAKASAVNRLFGKVANACALPYPDTDLPKGELTGNPIRLPVVAAVAAADRDAARAELELDPDRLVLAVWAGSLGARRINDAVADLAERWRDRGDVAIHHVVGRRDFPDFAHLGARFADAAVDYRVVEYEHRMAAVQVAADVAVCRSGASTTAELALAGLPSVLVPGPFAPRDAQRANAGELVAAGAAVIIDDGDVSGARLEETLGPWLDDRAGLAERAAAARSVARPDAAHEVGRLLIRHGGGA